MLSIVGFPAMVKEVKVSVFQALCDTFISSTFISFFKVFANLSAPEISVKLKRTSAWSYL
jgi:hypothetical protein